jgi:hypothetical protein
MIRQAVVHFVFQLVVAVAVAVAVVIAALWAVLYGGGFRYSLEVGLFVVGFAILLGALGLAGGSSTQRTIATARVPGLPAFIRLPEATRVNATALLLLTGAVLFVIAFFV